MSVYNALISLLLLTFACSRTVRYISNSKEARDNHGIILTKFTFHGKHALSKLRGNDSIGGLYFFPRDKLLNERPTMDCNQFLRKASFSLFPIKSETMFKERKYPLWSKEPKTFYVLFVDAATCRTSQQSQNNVGLELHLLNDEASGEHLSAEENGLKAAYLLLLIMFSIGAVWFGPSLYKTFSGGSMIFVIQLFLACIGQELYTLLSSTLHWVTYESNGWGWPFLNSLTVVTMLGADLAMLGLVVDVVLGWTLGSCKRISSSRSEMVFRIVSVLALSQVALHFYTSSLDVNDPNYFSFSSKSEILLSTIKGIEGVFLLATLATTYSDDRSPLRQGFYSSFAWIIVTWFLSHPLSHLLILLLAEYTRLKVFTSLSVFLRGCALAQLANIIGRDMFSEAGANSATFIPFAERSSGLGHEGVNYGNYANYYNHGYDKLTKRN